MAGSEALQGGPTELVHRRVLEAEHDRLVGLRRSVTGDVLDGIGPAGQETTGMDLRPGGSGTELEDRERDQWVLEHLDQQLRDVDDAISRLERGEYGMCEICGEAIGEARLEALPATRFCLRHQDMAERGAGRAVVSGGDIGPVSPI